MRCIYCMPANGIEKLERSEMLSYEQFLLTAKAAIALGIKKIRVTGGEPLVRTGIIPFLKQLAGISGLTQLVVTTNGVLLSKMAQQLRDAGVQRVNISLDSLQAAMFSQLSRRNMLSQVMAGIAATEKAGLPYKINMVVMRGFNDGEIIDFARLTQKHDCTVRFIEYMPVHKDANWHSLVVTREEITRRLNEHYCLYPVNRGILAGPAEEFTIKGSVGKIGVIAPLPSHSCQTCNRIRITAAGKLRTCLFSSHEYNLKPLLVSGNMEHIISKLQDLINDKSACHPLHSHPNQCQPFSMNQVGG